jgi:hypothetical protein
MGEYDGDPLFNGSCQYPKRTLWSVYNHHMMIVIPMIFQNVSFGFILKHFLNNDPRLAILLEFYCSLVQYVPYL